MKHYKSKVPDGASKVKCISIAGSKYDGTINPTEYADNFTVNKVYNIVKLSKHFVPMVRNDKDKLFMVQMKNFEYLDINGNIIGIDNSKPFVYHNEPKVINGYKCIIMIRDNIVGDIIDAEITITLPALPIIGDMITLSDEHLNMFEEEFLKKPENITKHKIFCNKRKEWYFGDETEVIYRWFNSDSDKITIVLD